MTSSMYYLQFSIAGILAIMFMMQITASIKFWLRKYDSKRREERRRLYEEANEAVDSLCNILNVKRVSDSDLEEND